MTLFLSIWSQVSLAAPHFLGSPADETVARAAWDAAEACTGRPGRALREIELRYRTIPGGYLGVAHTTDEGQLFRIDLNTDPERHREVLVHEVAHAWVSEGPIALVEGAAELLGDCMVARTPGLATLQFDDGRLLTGLQDLRQWALPGTHHTESLGTIRTDAYIGAARLMRTASLVLPPGALWPSDGLSWEGFEAQLKEAGPGGAKILEALEGGAAAQREALADRDLDGVPALAEALLHTSDQAFDSDGDGWWDGAILGTPPDSVAIPMDGSPVCSGWVPGQGTSVHVYSGGNLRGQDPPRVIARPGSSEPGWRPTHRTGRSWGTTVSLAPTGASILLQLEGSALNTTGAPWARVLGDHLSPDPGCHTTPQATLWAHDRGLVPLIKPLSAQVGEGIKRATERFGPATTRVAIALGGDHSTVEGHIVWLSTEEVRRAVATDKLTELAYLAVSLHHLWSRGERDWRAGEALARSLALEPRASAPEPSPP
ncbi:MAG TPA: hypothetical protein ENK18_07800 [Deltaproteobacteria bacterium]|nr:hypothetical protein [Deltaproteobacteria bacterium]